jgi:hypothetical protein
MDPFNQLSRRPRSRALAIKAFCASCMGCEPGNLVPGWRNDVKNCTAKHCPLYTFRPGAKHDD